MSEKQERIVPEEGNDQNVDKIREILFGANMREYEQRFADLEQRLIAENEKLGQFLEKRLTGIATATQRELSGLASRIEEQQQRMVEADTASREELGKVNHQISERLNDLDDLFGKESQALRNDLMEQYNELVGLVKETRKVLGEGIERESGRLGQAKLDREELSGLLAELSGRLRQGDSGEGS